MVVEENPFWQINGCLFYDFLFFVHDVLPLILKNLEKFTALLVDDVELYRLVLYRMTSQSIKINGGHDEPHY